MAPKPAGAPLPRATFTSPDVQLSIALAAAGFYLGGVGVVIVLLAEDLGLPVTSLAWMGSIFGLALLVSAPFGPLALRLGPQRLLALCATLSAAGYTLVALAPALGPVVVGAALQALGWALTTVLLPVLISGPRADVRVTRAAAASSLMSVAAPLLIGALITVGVDGRLSLLLAAGAALLVAGVALTGSPTARTTPDRPADVAGPLPARGLVVRRWASIAMSDAVQFSFLVWSVARLVEAGLPPAAAAGVGAAFPIGLVVGRLLSSWAGRVPGIPASAALTAAGTALTAVDSWPVIAAGLLLAGLGMSTLYAVTLVRLMGVPHLRPAVASSLGALASGVAITLAPAALALVGEVVQLRLAFLLLLPVLGVLVALQRDRGVREHIDNPR